MHAKLRGTEADPAADQRVILRGVSWSQFEDILRIRGERSVPRLTYLRGELELMSPSRFHESLKKRIARLVEAYAEQERRSLNGYGSWTVRSAPRERGVEPDECYILAAEDEDRDRPDFAIEVIWTHGGLDKLEVYRGLEVQEVWLWMKGRIEVHALRGEQYQRVERSELWPSIDLALVAELADLTDQSRAVAQLRERVRPSRARKKR